MECERCHDEFTVVRGDGDDEHPLCDSCAQEVVVELRKELSKLDTECWHAIALEQADYELDDVLTFLRRHERDQVLGITPPPLADLIAALERGEHRR